MLYDYTVKTKADIDAFKVLCLKIEAIPEVKKENRIIDVDGSIMEFYSRNNKEIVAHNDYYIGAIYIKSDDDLSEFLADFKTA